MSVQLGPTRRKEFGTRDFGVYNFNGGLNVKNTPQELGDHDLSIATNVYLRSDGGVQLRNGMSPQGSAPAVGQLILARFFQDIVNGVAQAETTKTLGQVGNTLYDMSNNAVIGNIHSSANANPMTWVRIQQASTKFYTGLTDCIVICTGSGGPYVYDGTNLYTPTGWASAASAGACALVNGILWFGQIPGAPNQIFGAGDGITANVETLPPYRNFILSAPVTGLCAIGTGANAILAVGRNTGLSLLYGTGPSTFYVQDVPFPDGITASRSMISASGVLYFLGHMAYYAFDGVTTPRRVSDKIEPWILNDPIIGLAGYPMTGHFNFTWATLYNNRIHLGYCSNSNTPNTVLCLDLVVGGWTVLVPGTGLSSMILYDAPGDPNPFTCYVGGVDGQMRQWDVNALATVTDGVGAVLGQAQSKFFKIGVPGTNKTLTRWYPEFFLSAVPFSIPVTFSTDYGNTTTAKVVDSSSGMSSVLIWDVGLWDIGLWGGSGFISFNAPASRVDTSIPFEALAVGVNQDFASAPWIWAGGTGAFHQRGRT